MPVACPHCAKPVEDAYTKDEVSNIVRDRLQKKDNELLQLQLKSAGVDPGLYPFLKLAYETAEGAKPAAEKREFAAWLDAADGPRSTPAFSAWFSTPTAPTPPAPAPTPPVAPAPTPPVAPAPPAARPVSPPPAAPAPPPAPTLTPAALRERFNSPTYRNASKEEKARLMASWQEEAARAGVSVG